MIIKAKGYNRYGDGITKINGKVFYVPNLLDGESGEVEILEEHEKWGIAKLLVVTSPSPQRNMMAPKSHYLVGGYELIHMNQSEQVKFKMFKVETAFSSNANYNISLLPMFSGKKQLRYRNKITLHDGSFYQRKSHIPLKISDFLLTDIKPYTSKKGDIIIRKLNTTISGKKNEGIFTTDTMLGMSFKVSIGAFYQVNKEVATEVYREILKNISPNEVVFDLFSGIGTITLLAAKKAKHVFGVERNKYSFNDAIDNQKRNKIKNVTFIKGDVNNVLPRMKDKVDTIIVDPARLGLKKKICELLLKIKAPKIIYLSCNPDTQASDFNRLKEKYEITYAKPYDMFPQTNHIENLIILKLKK